MPIGILFWVLYVLSIVLGLWSTYTPADPLWTRRAGYSVVVWVLIGLLGWSVFGPVVK